VKVCTGSSSDEEPDASNVRFGEDPGLRGSIAGVPVVLKRSATAALDAISIQDAGLDLAR
jgi:hypothetical protein